LFENRADKIGHYSGTDQRRPSRLDGDRLVIGDGKTWTGELKRVRVPSHRPRAVNISDGPD
jgi:hypothetical protein